MSPRPKSTEPTKVSSGVRIDPAIWAEVDRLCKLETRNRNNMIEVLLKEALKARGTKTNKSAQK
jgi:hypothetical protein